MHVAYLLTGSNLEEPQRQVAHAFNLLQKKAGTIRSVSGLYQTAAWGITDQADFINQAICLSTPLSPRALLKCILAIEIEMGRERKIKMGPRIIDIDILLYDAWVIEEPGLVIPHPLLPQRRFALEPLVEIAGQVLHPVLKKSMATLLATCEDPLDVYKISTE